MCMCMCMYVQCRNIAQQTAPFQLTNQGTNHTYIHVHMRITRSLPLKQLLSAPRIPSLHLFIPSHHPVPASTSFHPTYLERTTALFDQQCLPSCPVLICSVKNKKKNAYTHTPHSPLYSLKATTTTTIPRNPNRKSRY